MMADSTTEIDLDSVIDRLLEGELARLSKPNKRMGQEETIQVLLRCMPLACLQ